ncbi:MAG TPA: phosphopantetheine-binding protein, partial [Methylomirabilota bacterium]|nr:phosphopantetheine-binding protein [Methylomirabilota bacterium]
LTLNGKVNLSALPSIEEARQRAARVFVSPATETEARVADIWSQVLSVPQVSADADFFELGGHSLLATRIVARLREAFGIDLSLRVMFEAPTVRQLARQVDEALAAAPPATAVEGARAPAAHGGVVPEVASFEDQLAALESMSDDEAAALLGGEPGDLR